METLEGLEAAEDRVRLSANAGSLSIVFPRDVWETLVSGGLDPDGPTREDLAELDALKERLETHARENGFELILRDESAGKEGSGLRYHLVLRPAGLLALTTGYHFAPIVRPDLVARVGASVEEDQEVEQAYLVGAVATEPALILGSVDENVEALSVRGRRCSASRFEMPTELWQVLSGELGWGDVETVTGEAGSRG